MFKERGKEKYGTFQFKLHEDGEIKIKKYCEK